MILPDRRGRKTPANKVPDSVRLQIVQFLDKFPKYLSRCNTSNKLYFPPHLNKKQVFEMYKDVHPESKISNFVFRDVLKKISVHFYDPKRDLCSKCETCNKQMKSKCASCEKRLKPQLKNVMQCAIEATVGHKNNISNNIKYNISNNIKYNISAAKEILCTAEKEAKSNEDLLCFSFDIQRVQEIPYLTIPEANYKRHMWLYNVGVHTFRDNKGHIFTWTEVEGKRGGSDIVSCICQFLNEMDLSKYKKIHSFSDCRNDQNRNDILVSFMAYVCQTTRISWRHSFVEQGHNLLPNDSDFQKIEKTKKIQSGIYNHEQWMDIYHMCKFSVTHMEGKFFDFSQLSTRHFFNSSSPSSEKFDWDKLRDLMVTGDTGVIQFYTSHSPDSQMQQINFGLVHPFEPAPLYPNGLKISRKKYQDIMSLLKHIPNIYAQELVLLPHEEENSDCWEAHPDIEDENAILS